MAQSDEHLMERIRERDANAFEALWGRYAARVRGHLTRMVRDKTAADDLVQEVFLRVWTRAEQWEGRGSLEGWLFRIATNLALNYRRSVRRRKQRPLEVLSGGADEEDNPAPYWMIDAATLGPDAVLEQAERYERLRQLVAGLSEEKREVLRLAHEAEMDIESIAQTLGIPKGTVKSRLHYARKSLARRWEETERRKT